VLYGIKSLAIKNINEFLYGVRKNRFRTRHDGTEEEEPLLHFFWQASHHGVPPEKHIHADDFDFYIDLLGHCADYVGTDHTLKMKGGAFWNMLGSMTEIEAPVYVLSNVVDRAYGERRPHFAAKLKALLLDKAKAHHKLVSGPNPPKPCESYKSQIVGQQSMDSRGHLPFDTFLKTSLDAFRKQRHEDALGLNTVYHTWEDPEQSSFDTFSAMLLFAQPDIAERAVIELYSQATEDDDDSVRMEHIEAELRRKQITLRVKPSQNRGNKSHLDAVGLASEAVALFAHASERHEPDAADEEAAGAAAKAAALSMFHRKGGGDSEQHSSGSSPSGSGSPGSPAGKWGRAFQSVRRVAMIRSILAAVEEAQTPSSSPAALRRGSNASEGGAAPSEG